jgi:DnaK suppressor protein
MSRIQDLRRIRELLQRRRRDVLDARAAVQSELKGLKAQERDPEYEEGAQVDLADYTLWRLMESQRRELELIDAAFERMDQGVFGACCDCGLPISSERLLAVPFALRCEEDAQRLEQERAGEAQPSL